MRSVLIVMAMVMSMVAAQQAQVGQEREWHITGSTVTSQVDNLLNIADPAWRLVAVADLNGDHIVDQVLINDTTGGVIVRIMLLDPNGISMLNYAVFTNVPLPVPQSGKRWNAHITTGLGDPFVRIQWRQEVK